MYMGVLPAGMEEELLEERAAVVMKQIESGEFAPLASDTLSKKDLMELQEEYREHQKKLGGHRKCNFAELGQAQGLFAEGCAYVYVHCNYDYGELDWILYFDEEYTLLSLEMELDESSLKDPNIQRV